MSDESLNQYVEGLMIIRADQSPYSVKNVREISETAEEDVRHKTGYNRSEKLQGIHELPLRVWNVLYNIRWGSDYASPDYQDKVHKYYE